MRIWINARKIGRYLRIEYKNGGRHEWSEIVEAMTWGSLYADLTKCDRVLVVVHIKLRDYYPVGDLAQHAKIADELFHGKRVAYVSDGVAPERIRFVHAALTRLGNMTIKSFAEEKSALLWLLSDEER